MRRAGRDRLGTDIANPFLRAQRRAVVYADLGGHPGGGDTWPDLAGQERFRRYYYRVAAVCQTKDFLFPASNKVGGDMQRI